MALVKTTVAQQVREDDDHLFSGDDMADFVLCKGPHKLKALIDALQPGKAAHYVSDGDWSMHDLVTELLPRYKPADIFITTYALREFPVRQLIMALESKTLLSVSMLLDARSRTRTPEVLQLAQFNLSRIRLTSIHAKVTVIRGAAGAVTIVGSANWTQNPRIECGIVTMDEAAAAFHINWIEKIMANAEIFE